MQVDKAAKILHDLSTRVEYQPTLVKVQWHSAQSKRHPPTGLSFWFFFDLLFLLALCLNQFCFVSNHQRCIIIRKTLCGQSFVTIICQCNLWPTSSYRVEKRQVVPDPQPPPQPNSASSSNLNSTSSHPLLIMFSTLWWFLELVFAYLINSKQGIHWKNAVDFDWHWFLLHIDDIMIFLSFRVI